MDIEITISLNEVYYSIIYFGISAFIAYVFLKSNLFFKIIVFLVGLQFALIVINLNSWLIATTSLLGIFIIFRESIINGALMAYDIAENSFYWLSDVFGSIKDIFLKIFRTVTLYGINFFVFIYNTICILFKLKKRFLYWGDAFQKYNHTETVSDQSEQSQQQRNHKPKNRTYKKPYNARKKPHKSGTHWREENRKREEALRKAQDEAKRAKRETRQAQEQAERQKQWANEQVRKAREEAKQQANGQQQSTSQNNTQSKPSPDNRNHQEILGLNTPGFTQAELKQAYKRASAKYHPDKHTHMSQEFQDQASEEFKKIQRAYKLLQSVAV